MPKAADAGETLVILRLQENEQRTKTKPSIKAQGCPPPRPGRALPGYVEQAFEDYLKCGRLEEGFLRVRCESCHAEHLVAFSCRRRGFCPSCGARRMAESAALLVDEVFPEQPVRQWVLSVPSG